MNGKTMLNGVPYFSDTQVIELTRAEYDALPNSKYTDGVLYCIKDEGAMKGDTFSPIIYSLAEREIGVWTDGKPLYQKTIVGQLTSSGETYVTLNITNADFYKLYDLAICAPQNRTFYNGYCLSDIFCGGFINNTSSGLRASIYIGSSSLMRPATAYITVIYTKTTDNPGTGKWTPSGVPAHHYSTNEQVIGTWIDGKPLYQKVIEFTTPTQSQANTEVKFADMPSSAILRKKIEFLFACNGSWSQSYSDEIIGRDGWDTITGRVVYGELRIKMKTGSGTVNYNAYCGQNATATITYTKSTD